MNSDTYRPAKWYAAEIRKNIKAAQRSGELDPKWKISVRTELDSLCAEVVVRVENARNQLELFTKDDDRLTGYHYSDEAIELVGQIRRYMAPAAEWHDGRRRFLFLYLSGGLLAP